MAGTTTDYGGDACPIGIPISVDRTAYRNGAQRNRRQPRPELSPWCLDSTGARRSTGSARRRRMPLATTSRRVAEDRSSREELGWHGSSNQRMHRSAAALTNANRLMRFDNADAFAIWERSSTIMIDTPKGRLAVLPERALRREDLAEEIIDPRCRQVVSARPSRPRSAACGAAPTRRAERATR